MKLGVFHLLSLIKSALKLLKHLEDVSNDRPLLKAAINEDKSFCLKVNHGRKDSIKS